jgi:hypothetical protein
VEIIVPSKDKNGKDIPPAVREAALNKVRKRFLRLAKGSSAKPQEKERVFSDPYVSGEYDPETGEVTIREAVTNIRVYLTDDEAINIESEIEKLAEDICKECDQECVAVIIDGVFQYISPD